MTSVAEVMRYTDTMLVSGDGHGEENGRSEAEAGAGRGFAAYRQGLRGDGRSGRRGKRRTRGRRS